MRGAEVRLVLSDRLALVVEHRAARADPAALDMALNRLAVGVTHQAAGADVAGGQGNIGLTLGGIARFGLNLLLDLAPEAVRVGEAELDPGLRAAGVVDV